MDYTGTSVRGHANVEKLGSSLKRKCLEKTESTELEYKWLDEINAINKTPKFVY
jgi:hypothetical protein